MRYEFIFEPSILATPAIAQIDRDTDGDWFVSDIQLAGVRLPAPSPLLDAVIDQITSEPHASIIDRKFRT